MNIAYIAVVCLLAILWIAMRKPSRKKGNFSLDEGLLKVIQSAPLTYRGRTEPLDTGLAEGLRYENSSVSITYWMNHPTGNCTETLSIIRPDRHGGILITFVNGEPVTVTLNAAKTVPPPRGSPAHKVALKAIRHVRSLATPEE